MSELEHGQKIDIEKLLDPEVTLHSIIFSWREQLTVDLPLLESLKGGQLQRIIFRMKGDKHELLIGSRRYFHQKLLGKSFEDIPKEIKENVTDRDALLMAASENIFREDFNPFEEARVINDLVQTAKIKPKDLARRFNKSESWVRSRIALMKLPKKTRNKFENKGIPMGYAAVVMKLSKYPEAQEKLLGQIEYGLEHSYSGVSSVEEAEHQVNGVLKEVKEAEALFKKYGACPKCDSPIIKEGYQDDNQVRCGKCGYQWHAETKEPWKYYELKQAAKEQGIEIVESDGKLELTPRDVADIMERKEVEQQQEKDEEDGVEKIPEKFRSKIALDKILFPLLVDNLQKITVKGSTIDIELIEDTDLYFKGLKKDYKAGELARIETHSGYAMNTQESAKKLHAHIKKATGE